MGNDTAKEYLNPELLKIAIADAGWDQAEFARRSGLSEAAVSRLLSGERNLGRQSIIGIMRAFPDKNITSFLRAREAVNA
jgi:transcriptional regulator with XRE-family HTH domain